MIKICNARCYGNFVYTDEGEKYYIGEMDEWWYGKEVELHLEIKKILGFTKSKPIFVKLKESR